MERLFERHDTYLSIIPMEYVRDFVKKVNWNSRLIVIKCSSTRYTNTLGGAAK